ncbi:MAG: hypothetical protein GWN01_16075 [Nitrosopumilaceae archaeon]|nr:hypothetical protein [Nitrosopumilaceae archaeon]NIU88812.1 hypothetical protein [Nitrosopumilaceae archaeon]NIV66937.1 hypothetical protein [Nitrosopumilaceae archaeon]NIX62956.1 hypothetical protein [Nitrosopumilaceae archaeon]
MKKVTSVKLEEDIFRRAKIEAINRGMTLGDFIEEALKREMKKGGR